MSAIQSDKPNFLKYLHSFRGFAIINIVVLHAIGFAIFEVSKDPKYPISIVNELLFHNSTIYFALISGLLYTAVLKKKGYAKFYASKLKYVILPYLFFTLLYTAFDIGKSGLFIFRESFTDYLNNLPRNFIYGKAIFVLWYIPVLVFLYLVTPLLNFIMSIEKWGKWLIFLIIAIPLVVNRDEVMELYKSDYLSLANMIYFTGAYAAGMFLADNLEERTLYLQSKKHFLLIIVLLSTAMILYITINDYDKIGEFSILSTLYYIQKLVISFLMLLFFKNLGENQPKWLMAIANDAFAIYFLHILFFIIFCPDLGYFTFINTIAQFSSILAGLILLLLSIVSSMVVVWLFKKLFGKYSRMLVGS